MMIQRSVFFLHDMVILEGIAKSWIQMLVLFTIHLFLLKKAWYSSDFRREMTDMD